MEKLWFARVPRDVLYVCLHYLQYGDLIALFGVCRASVKFVKNDEKTKRFIKSRNTVCKIVHGVHHGFAMKMNGDWLVWGHNFEGQLGLNDRFERLTPVKTSFSFVTIVCGRTHNFGLTREGDWFAWGENNFRLGLGDTHNRVAPTKTNFRDLGIVEIVCGDFCNFGRKKNKKWLAWGSGPLGFEHERDIATPTETNFTFSKILCCGPHNFGMTEERNWFAWGWNFHGQLGTGDKRYQTIPIPTASFDVVFVDLVSCDYRTFAKTPEGKWLAFGNNDFGQLGTGDFTERLLPTETYFTFEKIVCAAHHCYGQAKNGNWFVWGRNLHGELGVEDSQDRLSPTELTPPFRDIFTSAIHSFGIGRDDKVYSWGNNIFGELGLGHKFDKHIPKIFLQ